jgi:uncharacterized protein (DUF2062 family)
MVSKRRTKPTFSKRMRRRAEYLGYRIRRLPDNPHRIALGLSCGVYASFTPFFGLHVFVAMGLAKLLRANVAAGLIGTVAGNPLTFPLIASLALSLGRRILGYGLTGRDFHRIVRAFSEALVGLWQSILSLFGIGESQWQKLSLFLNDIFWPYFVGGLLPGLIAAIAVYYITRPLIGAFQSRRRAKLLARARQRIAKKNDMASMARQQIHKAGMAGANEGKT